MRKSLLMIAGSFILSAGMYAAGIGFVDTQYILEKYPETKRTQMFLEEKKKDLQKILDEEKNKVALKDKEIQEKGSTATEEEKKEIEKMKESFKSKFEMMQENLDQLQYNMYDKLKSDISMAIREVGKNKSLDVVVDKAVVYYGGEDVTEEVIKFLSGVEKIELK